MYLRHRERAPRVPLHLRVTLDVAGRRFEAKLVDLSVTGGFVELDEPLPLGTELVIALPLPGGEPLETTATVVRVGTNPKFVTSRELDHLVVSVNGVGLNFARLPDDEGRRLADYLDLVQEW